MMILFIFAGFAWVEKKYHLIVTETFRTLEDDKKLGISGPDIHIDGRAVDCCFCDENLGRILDDRYSSEISEKINKKIPYGMGQYPTVLYHDQGTGKHFHIQVSSNGETKILR